MSMNLNHRLADGTQVSGIDLVFLKIRYPLTIAIPLFIILLSFYEIRNFFVEVWKTGNLSIVFVPLIGDLTHSIFGSTNIFLSAIVLIGYALGPISFYFFVLQLTKRHITAVITALLLLLPAFPFSSSVPARLQLALLQNDGAHVLGLTVTAFLLTFFLWYIRSGTLSHLLLFEFFGILLGLISFFSVFILLIYIFLVSLSEILIGQGKLKFVRFLKSATLLITLLLCIYNVSIIRMLFSERGISGVAYVFNIVPLTFFIVPVFGTFAFLIFDRRPHLQSVFIAVTLGLFNFVSNFVSDFILFDSQRYSAEVSFTNAFIASLVLMWGFDLLRSGFLIQKIPQLTPFKNQLAFTIITVVLITLISSILFIERTV